MSAHYRDFPNCRSSTICTTLSLHYSDLIARRLISSAVTTVVCSGLETHLYVSSLSRFPELQVIYDMHNVESPLFDAISVDSGVPDPDLGLIKEAESLAVSTANDIWTCSDD